jgi:arylsulfatase A-like enzyme
MPPFAFIENDHFTEPMTTTKTWLRTGPASEGFEALDVLPTLTQKAVEYISKQAKTRKPFFLYLPLTSPHTPILPTNEWKGKSGISPYGDFVMQTDWALGQVLDALEKEGIRNNTLIIFTSDNGCSKAANIKELQSKGHYPSAEFRGSKSDLWDGGHRIPFIVRWPATVAPGSTCSQLFCLTDLMATCADLVGTQLPDNEGEDSFSFLQALKGKPIVSDRAGVIHHSIEGYFSYRQGKWKLLLSKGSGGWSSPTEKEVTDSIPVTQLYDLEKDPGETNNLYNEHPEIANQLIKQLEYDVQRGRSRSGSDVKNDIDKIVLWKNNK